MSETPISVTDVSLAYRLSRNRAATLKEYAISAMRRQIVHEEFWALNEVDFTVGRGEVFGVIGPNGAGKSTLMKAVAGILPPNKGRIIVRGSVSPLIEVGGGLNDELTGRENIVIYGAMLGRDPEVMRERTDQIAGWAGLRQFLTVPVRSYSTGMRSRLAFSIATDARPDVLLVDEVLAVGDEQFKIKSFKRIRDMMDAGTTVLLVSHQLKQVEELSTRVLWLDHGNQMMLGPATEVVDAYRAAVDEQAEQDRKDEAEEDRQRDESGESS